jgi:hypothetical protein
MVDWPLRTTTEHFLLIICAQFELLVELSGEIKIYKFLQKSNIHLNHLKQIERTIQRIDTRKI